MFQPQATERAIVDFDDYKAFQSIGVSSEAKRTIPVNSGFPDSFACFGFQNVPRSLENLSSHIYWKPTPSSGPNAPNLQLQHQSFSPPINSSSYYYADSLEIPSSPSSRFMPQDSGYNSYRSSPAAHAYSHTYTLGETFDRPHSISSKLKHSKLDTDHSTGDDPLNGHRQQLKLFKEALQLPIGFDAGPFIPQKMYTPYTNTDRRRYVDDIDLQLPIYFWTDGPGAQCGISLMDALHSRVRCLRDYDEPVFEGRGPSISVRIQWPGYMPWSRQIPTKDFRSPPQPITKAKLAKNVAKCVERFLSERTSFPLEDGVDSCWKIGAGRHEIKFEDLYLVSIHHVSMGSWQPHLRLCQPLRNNS